MSGGLQKPGFCCIDLGNYEESWDRTAQIFKSRVDKAQWVKNLDTNRRPLGKVKSRQLLSATYVTDLPDSPRGEYVLLEYEVSFEHDTSSRETITPYLTEDGEWHVAGYFLQ